MGCRGEKKIRVYDNIQVFFLIILPFLNTEGIADFGGKLMTLE